MRGRRCAVFVLALLAGGVLAKDAEIERLLDSADPIDREKAAELLGKQGNTSAAKKLIELLEDRDWGVRLAAIRALGTIRFSPGYDALRKQALEGDILLIRELAARAIRDHDAKRSGGVIARRINSLKKEDRLPYIRALGIIGGEEGVKALEKQMRAIDPLHRAAAARALGRLGVGEKPLARAAAKERKREVALPAMVALGYVDSDKARETLLDVVDRSSRGTDAYVLRRIGRSAAAANRAAWVAALRTRLERPKRPADLLRLAWSARLKECADAARAHLRDRDPLARAYAYRVAGLGDRGLPWDEVAAGLDHKDERVKYAAALAYLDSSGDELVEATRTLLRHEQSTPAELGVRRAVATGMEEALPELVAIARGETGVDWISRVAACVAIGRVGHGQAIEPLVKLAHEREWWLRGAALEGLYHTFRKEAIPVLLSAFDDRHPVVRNTARRNLRYLTRKSYPTKKLYEGWWGKVKDTLEIVSPEKRAEKAKAEKKKYGYAPGLTPKHILEVLRGTDIVAVKGAWDKVERILEDLSVKHAAVRAQQINDYGLSPKQVILVNCEGNVDSRVGRFLQWFVAAGGYLATTDWALVHTVNRLFPGILKAYERQSTGNDVVEVEAAEPEHPSLRGVFRDGVRQKWWLEIQAFPIRVDDPIRVTVLVDSLEMYTRYGQSAMMVEFPVGLGKILHSTSHFYLQKEGFATETDAARRRVFAADHLGLSVEEIRELDAKGTFDDMQDTTPISRSYSMFHVLVNFIEEKRRIDRTW
jgi:HEAT repeat protein